MGNNFLSINKVDLLNSSVESEDFFIDTDFIANSSEFFLGGSDQYFRGSSGEDTTSRVSLNSFALFSGYVSDGSMFSISSGLVGNYFDGTSTNIENRRITGYNQTTVYKTGITGYDYQNTGDINLSTG